MQYVLSALGSLCRKSCRKLISVRRAWNKLFSNLQNIPFTITHLLCTSAQDKQCAEAFLVWEANATLLWRVAVEEGGVETFYWSLRHPPNKAHWGRGQRWSPIFYFFLIWDMKGKICSMIWIVKPHNSLFLVKLHKIKLCFFHNHHFLQFLSRLLDRQVKNLSYMLSEAHVLLYGDQHRHLYIYISLCSGLINCVSSLDCGLREGRDHVGFLLPIVCLALALCLACCRHL